MIKLRSRSGSMYYMDGVDSLGRTALQDQNIPAEFGLNLTSVLWVGVYPGSNTSRR